MTSYMVKPAMLYRLYDRNDRLLYIGITLNPAIRWHRHSRAQEWWPDVATIRLEHFPSRREALRAEQDSIKAEMPVYNVQDYPGRHPNSLLAREAGFTREHIRRLASDEREARAEGA